MSELHYFVPRWVTATDATLSVDACIYGGTSAGLVAGIKLAQLGHRALVLHPGRFVGGLTTGGLGWTDFGKKQVVGGLARQFYADCGKPYGKSEEWQFEPHVASAVFDQWLKNAGVDVRLGQFLDRVEMDGQRIASLTMLGGLKVKARIFLDATYEGDLLARAGVKYFVGRESNDTYGETLNGVQVRQWHQFGGATVDPFVKAGDPASGLLPQVRGEDLTARIGQGDRSVQAYCFRMCMTDDPALKIPWEKPDAFDPRQYILASRWFAGPKDEYNEHLHGDNTVPRKFDILPNRTAGGYCKTDTNNHGAVSSDFIGANHAWPEADYATREKIFQAHVTYQKGYYWFVANDPSIPDHYRKAYARWGLPKDEFVDCGHWPHALYVREGRRMVGDYVVTEADCVHRRQAEDSVGMGSYGMDSHNCNRFVLMKDGRPRVMNEGDVQVKCEGPYPISYRAITPARGQCENLLVPVCISTSHIAYGSARMEPVFMVLGESAAIAASLTLRQGVAVQDVSYPALRSKLEEAGQVL